MMRLASRRASAFGRSNSSRALPFEARTAQMLMKVAADERLTNANLGSHLPLRDRRIQGEPVCGTAATN